MVVNKSDFDPMYSRIHHGFTERYSLKAQEVILLSIIVSYSEAGSTSWLSNASYAKLTGTTVPSVIKYLGRLKKLGLIEIRSRSRFGTNEYELGDEGRDTLEELLKLIPPSSRNRY